MLSTLLKLSRGTEQQVPYDIEFLGMTVRVTPKKVKTIRLKVNLTDKSISVTAPYYLSTQEVMQFLLSKQNWLLRQLQKSVPADAPLIYDEGEKLPLWGETLLIRQQLARKKDAYIDGNNFVFCAPETLDTEAKRKMLGDFYRQEMLKEANHLMKIWQPRIGKPVSFLGIKNMKTKWGSCNITKARVWLSLYLAQHPKACIEMVLVHELVHLLEASHSKKFYDTMTEYLPSWKATDAILKSQPTQKI